MRLPYVTCKLLTQICGGAKATDLPIALRSDNPKDQSFKFTLRLPPEVRQMVKTQLAVR